MLIESLETKKAKKTPSLTCSSMGSQASKEQQQQQQDETSTDTGKDETSNDKPSHSKKDDDDGVEVIHNTTASAQAESNHTKDRQDGVDGLWIGVDLGTSNCASAIWDSTRGRPKWMRLKGLAWPQQNGKAGRIVPSAVQIQMLESSSTNRRADHTGHSILAANALWEDIQKWNPTWKPGNGQVMSAIVGHKALRQLQQQQALKETSSKDHSSSQPDIVLARILTSMKRVLGVCDTTKLSELDMEFRASLPFSIEENEQGQWIIPYCVSSNNERDESMATTTIINVRPVHIAAMILQAIRQEAHTYLASSGTRKKKMQFPGSLATLSADLNNLPAIQNVVIGVPAYFGQTQRHAVEQAARLAGFEGHVSTLTEATAAAMAYGLFVGQPKDERASKAILVLDMGGGTTDITIAKMKNNSDDESQDHSERPDQKFQVMLNDGDSRLGGEDMDMALLDLVVQKATPKKEQIPVLTPQQRQILLRSCQQAKEALCGDVDHGDLPKDAVNVALPDCFPVRSIQVTQKDLDKAIKPLLDRTARLLERVLLRYSDKEGESAESKKENLIREVILIGGATRVPALRQLLKNRFFPTLDLCTSVNAMGAVAQGTAIQAAIVSQRVPLHELRSAMMLDTMPHAIGVMLPGRCDDYSDEEDKRFVEILPRDTPLPARGYATFYVADLDQKGVTISAVEFIAEPGDERRRQYQPVGDFTFLLHRLTDSQKEAIRNSGERPGLRPVDVGMTLDTDGAFQVSVFDSNDPDHIQKKDFYEKSKQSGAPEFGLLDYVQAAAFMKSEGITAEETRLMVALFCLLVFYALAKVLVRTDEMMTSEEGLVRIL
jgi:molecular chaperone DnaK (HSP70)